MLVRKLCDMDRDRTTLLGNTVSSCQAVPNGGCAQQARRMAGLQSPVQNRKRRWQLVQPSSTTPSCFVVAVRSLAREACSSFTNSA